MGGELLLGVREERLESCQQVAWRGRAVCVLDDELAQRAVDRLRVAELRERLDGLRVNAEPELLGAEASQKLIGLPIRSRTSAGMTISRIASSDLWSPACAQVAVPSLSQGSCDWLFPANE